MILGQSRFIYQEIEMERILVAMSIVLLVSALSFADRICTADQVYSDPIGNVGCDIVLSGRVKKITNVSFPMEFIIKSDGYLLLVQYFPKLSTRGAAIQEGKKYHLKGAILGSKQVIYDGSMVKLPQVYCTAIE